MPIIYMPCGLKQVPALEGDVVPSSLPLPPACVHCFTGTAQQAAAYVAAGLFIGLTGTVCMPRRGRQLRQLLHDGVGRLHKATPPAFA